MNPEFSFKLRRIYLPYVIVLLGCTLVYSFTNWAITMRVKSDFQEQLTDTTLPFIVGALATLIFLYRRIRTLHVVSDRGGDAFPLMLIVTALSIGVSVCNAQKYLRDATGKLFRLQTIGAVNAAGNNGKFYTIKDCYIDKTRALTYFHQHYAGKGGTTLVFDYYVLLPFYERKTDSGKIQAWLGIHFNDESRTSGNSEEEFRQRTNFIAQSDANYENDQFPHFGYFIKPGNTAEHDIFLQTLRDYNKTEAPILMIPQNNYIETVSEKRFWFVVVLGITLAVTLLFVFISDLKYDVLAAIKKSHTGQNRKKTTNRH